MIDKLMILILVVLISSGCAGHSAKEKIPPHPSEEAIWIYGHYDAEGRWIPGRWIE